MDIDDRFKLVLVLGTHSTHYGIQLGCPGAYLLLRTVALSLWGA